MASATCLEPLRPPRMVLQQGLIGQPLQQILRLGTSKQLNPVPLGFQLSQQEPAETAAAVRPILLCLPPHSTRPACQRSCSVLQSFQPPVSVAAPPLRSPACAPVSRPFSTSRRLPLDRVRACLRTCLHPSSRRPWDRRGRPSREQSHASRPPSINFGCCTTAADPASVGIGLAPAVPLTVTTRAAQLQNAKLTQLTDCIGRCMVDHSEFRTHADDARP